MCRRRAHKSNKSNSHTVVHNLQMQIVQLGDFTSNKLGRLSNAATRLDTHRNRANRRQCSSISFQNLLKSAISYGYLVDKSLEQAAVTHFVLQLLPILTAY